jgi:hypothetical protein
MGQARYQDARMDRSVLRFLWQPSRAKQPRSKFNVPTHVGGFGSEPKVFD